jgi:hypothetical protein
VLFAVGLTVGFTVGFAVDLVVGFAVALEVTFAVGFGAGFFVAAEAELPDTAKASARKRESFLNRAPT